jgi:iron-sulfur cluster assembly protein
VLTLTPEAVSAVIDVVVARDLGPTSGLRISAGPASAVDGSWNYAVVPERSAGDVVVEDGAARVFVEPDAARELEDAVLDAHVDEDTLDARFVVRTG